ncbi:MAG: hypothetical protein B6242_04160 [Anaerolineaceae bacterium 4572_78]|nr:MAG: hypothetical protein B6242_04160 [Anaerolineaceae bacterium 4572_78]
MLNPKDQQYAERIKELIEEGQVIATLEKPTKKPGIKTIQDNYRLQKWLTNVEQIVKTTFGQNSLQFQNLSELLKGSTYYASAVRGITGLLAGALEDLEKGFLLEKEILIAGEIF